MTKPVVPRSRRLAPGASLQKGELQRLMDKAKLQKKAAKANADGVNPTAVAFGIFFLIILLVELFATLAPSKF